MTGSGTQFNMNVNEVIANAARYWPVSPARSAAANVSSVDCPLSFCVARRARHGAQSDHKIGS